MMPTFSRRWRFTRLASSTVALLIVSAIGYPRAVWSHPLHTTLTEVLLDPTDGTIRLTIRAFADDFSGAVARRAGKQRPADYRVLDSDVAAYVAAAVSVEDATGRRAAMTWGGVRRSGDLMWITVRFPSLRSLRGVKLASTLLFEVFDDQVNIVQAANGGNRHSTLFVAGDGRKLKPLRG